MRGLSTGPTAPERVPMGAGILVGPELSAPTQNVC